MKFKILVPLLCLCFLSSCYTSQLVSKFSGTQVELGAKMSLSKSLANRLTKKWLILTISTKGKHCFIKKIYIGEVGSSSRQLLLLSILNWSAKRLSEKKGNSITKNILVGKNINLPQLARIKISSYLVPIFNPSFLIFNIPSILHEYSRKR